MFEARGTLRLKHSGMEFAVWTFKHASQEPLERAAKPALQGLLMLLDNGEMPRILLEADLFVTGLYCCQCVHVEQR